jgi:hypothetical protein
VTVTKIRLFDGARELVLGGRDNTRDDILVHKINPGSPTVRTVAEDRTGAHGQYDTTRYYSGRVVEMVATVWSPSLLREITTYLSPALRPMLGITDPDIYDGERFLLLRRDNFTPGDIDHMAHIRRPLQFQWACPTGAWQATDPVTFELNAETEDPAGITFPIEFPISFPAAQPRGRVLHTNPGTEPADQVARLYGPCRGPRYTNDTTGETLAFTTDLVIGLGEYVEIDTANHTAYYLSDPAATRAHFLDYTVSTWWQIPPGQSVVRYHPTSEVDAGSGSVTTYRPAWVDQ